MLKQLNASPFDIIEMTQSQLTAAMAEHFAIISPANGDPKFVLWHDIGPHKTWQTLTIAQFEELCSEQQEFTPEGKIRVPVAFLNKISGAPLH